MKKINFLILIILMLFPLYGCINNDLIYENDMVYESEDKSVRLEIGLKFSYTGRIYVVKEGIEHSYAVSFSNRHQIISIYLDPFNANTSFFYLKVNFEKINFFKKNKDVMYLTEKIKNNNPPNDILKNFNEKLIRNRKLKVYPLNYMFNKWYSIENKIEFINNDSDDFYYGRIKGTLKEENVIIVFYEDKFIIKNNIGEKRLRGKYKFENLNMILMPFDYYVSYPKKITLKFEEI